MDYQVWTKDQYGDQWGRKDCGDKGAVEREILAAHRRGEEPIITVEVPFDLELKIGEPGSEVKKPPAKKRPPDGKYPIEEVELEADQDPAEQNQSSRG